MATKTNSVDGKLVKGTSKADSITNSGSDVTISGGAGDDTIVSTTGTKNVSISGGKGNDLIEVYNFANYDNIYTENITIDGGAGDDSIDALGKNLFFVYSGGNDYIEYFSSNYKLQIASGTMNSVINSNGKDLFLTVGENIITLAGAAGIADSLNVVNAKGKKIKYSVKPQFNFTSSNDSVTNWLSNVKMNAGKGNDTVYNHGWYALIHAGNGDDYIFNFSDSEYSSIDGGQGNDTIQNGGAGNDYVYNDGWNVTIDGGTGDDTIENTPVYANSVSGRNVLFVYSGGNDSIQGFDDTSTLKIASGTMNSVINSNGKDLFLTVGENIITLAGAARKTDSLNIVNAKGKAVKYSVNLQFNFTSGNDSVSNYLSNVTLNAGKGNDTIYNSGFHNVSIYGGAGNDKIYNGVIEENSFAVGITNVTIDAGSGKDYIYDFASLKTSISGGAGNDSVFLDGISSYDVTKYATVNAGAGNDIVSLSSYAEDNVIQYASGDGNDIVYGLGTNTLSIANGKGTYSTKKSGSDIVVTVGKGKISLVGAASLSAVHINDDIILTNESNSPVTVDSSVKTIDASARTTAIKNRELESQHDFRRLKG